MDEELNYDKLREMIARCNGLSLRRRYGVKERWGRNIFFTFTSMTTSIGRWGHQWKRLRQGRIGNF